MVKRDEVAYFGAGPAAMPTPVLEEASRVVLDYKSKGIGISEMSHRSKDAEAVLTDAKQALAQLLEIPDDYEILFMQGGGSGQFSAVVYYMISVWVAKVREACETFWKGSSLADAPEEDKFREFSNVVKKQLKLDYLVTGSWSLKASQEAARLVGPEYVNVATDSRKANGGKFGVIEPESDWKLSNTLIEAEGSTPLQPVFTYYCDNETVDGVEFPGFPARLEADQERNVIADMSSNILSRKVDVKKFAAIFFGAQKNVGSTGVTVVILRKSLLPPQSALASSETLRKLGLPVGPVVLDWATIAKNNSLYNTLPIFDVWIAGQVMKRLLETHGSKGLGGQQELADFKSQQIYSTLDKHPEVYQVVPDKAVRSRMNICLRIKGGDADAEAKFLSGAEQKSLLGLKGHRSVGGIRISNYNAISKDQALKLVAYLEDFAKAQ